MRDKIFGEYHQTAARQKRCVRIWKAGPMRLSELGQQRNCSKSCAVWPTGGKSPSVVVRNLSFNRNAPWQNTTNRSKRFIPAKSCKIGRCAWRFGDVGLERRASDAAALNRALACSRCKNAAERAGRGGMFAQADDGAAPKRPATAAPALDEGFAAVAGNLNAPKTDARLGQGRCNKRARVAAAHAGLPKQPRA